MKKPSSIKSPPNDHAAYSPSPLPRRVHLTNLLLNIFRHALPLVPFYWFQGTIAGYVLMTAFDLSLGLILIVGTTRAETDPTSVDPRSRGFVMRLTAVLTLSVFFASVAAFIMVPIAMPALFFGLYEKVDWSAFLLNPRFWMPVLLMSLLAGLRAQLQFEATTTLGRRGIANREGPVIGDLQQDRRNSLAAKAAQITLIGTFVLICYFLLTFDFFVLRALPILYAAVLVFYDARPDLAQRIFPDLWKEK